MITINSLEGVLELEFAKEFGMIQEPDGIPRDFT
jgi:hypothetical protein